MEDQDVEWRANDAKALLENPLLKDIFEQHCACVQLHGPCAQHCLEEFFV